MGHALRGTAHGTRSWKCEAGAGEGGGERVWERLDGLRAHCTPLYRTPLYRTATLVRHARAPAHARRSPAGGQEDGAGAATPGPARAHPCVSAAHGPPCTPRAPNRSQQ
eukprot:74739-Rhodomonas_salina.1